MQSVICLPVIDGSIATASHCTGSSIELHKLQKTRDSHIDFDSYKVEISAFVPVIFGYTDLLIRNTDHCRDMATFALRRAAGRLAPRAVKVR